MAGEPKAAEGLSVEQERLELERRRLALESSFPRKWGPVLFGSLATIAVAIISGAVSWVATNSQNQLTERENQREQHNHQIENARTALDMYFKNADLLSSSDPRSLYHMRMLAEISDNEGVRTVFVDMRNEMIDKLRRENPEKEITEIAAALPSINLTQATDQTSYQDFTVYIQYPKSEGDSARKIAQAVLDALGKAGMRTPGMEAIDPAKVPDASEIRFYTPQQQTKLVGLAETLKTATGITFKPNPLKRSGLPESIFEIWIGKNDI